MRVRRKKHGAERLEKCSAYALSTPITDFNEVFGNGNDIHIEIGCGKGNFICANAKKFPNTNFIAIERVSDVLVVCAEKIAADELNNVRFICADAHSLAELFPHHSIKRIYLNFSDPWPKKGYAKRRLTHSGFLEIYKQLLTADGELFFKTDNSQLFDFSLEQLEENGFKLRAITRDLHSSQYVTDNIMTEYEQNFVNAGIKINRVEAYL